MSEENNRERETEILDQSGTPIEPTAESRTDVNGSPNQRDPEVMAQEQSRAQDAANEGVELEFENRILPIIEEFKQYRDDLANVGDEAGVSHTSHLLDTIVQRFRLPSDVHRAENASAFGRGGADASGSTVEEPAGGPEEPAETTDEDREG